MPYKNDNGTYPGGKKRIYCENNNQVLFEGLTVGNYEYLFTCNVFYVKELDKYMLIKGMDFA